ncbi:MAG: glycosyltransferase, partial [Nitrososphaera sp.]
LASENQAARPEPLIISPPVNVEEFRPALYSADRRDHILVTSRVHPSKMLENAIHLASILKQKKIGKGMIIAGNLMEDDSASVKYYKSIVGMIRKFEVSDYVTLETNVPLTGLTSLMRKCKVYFHPLPGEPFGISIIEAMSAGLIAVVPDMGGHTEVVSKKYQFHSLIEAPAIISSALNATQEERVRVSNSVAGFSLSQYLKDFQRVIRENAGYRNRIMTYGATKPTMGQVKKAIEGTLRDNAKLYGLLEKYDERAKRKTVKLTKPRT